MRTRSKSSRTRAVANPNSEELYALRKVWLDNEVLYREGVALGLDKGDKAIRERVIFKALSMVDAGVKLPPYDEATLREWFESESAEDTTSPRASISRRRCSSAIKPEAAARAFAMSLNTGAPGRHRSGSARVHGPAARQHRSELWRGVRRGARSVAAR